MNVFFYYITFPPGHLQKEGRAVMSRMSEASDGPNRLTSPKHSGKQDPGGLANQIIAKGKFS